LATQAIFVKLNTVKALNYEISQHLLGAKLLFISFTQKKVHYGFINILLTLGQKDKPNFSNCLI